MPLVHLISDNRTTVSVVRAGLGPGFHVTVGAIRSQVPANLPDGSCIVYDMDGGDGWRSILDDAHACPRPVVLVTATPVPQTIVESVRLGVADVIDRDNELTRLRPVVQSLTACTGTAKQHTVMEPVRLHHLTLRQRQILHLATTGMTSKAIAITLAVSKRTVDAHRSRMVRRVGAHCFLDLVREQILQQGGTEAQNGQVVACRVLAQTLETGGRE